MTTISRPVDAMLHAAATIHSVADTQWAKHMSLYEQRADSFRSVSLQLAAHLPTETTAEIQGRLDRWNTQLRACYGALHSLADALEQNAQVSAQVESDTQKSFIAESGAS